MVNQAATLGEAFLDALEQTKCKHVVVYHDLEGAIAEYGKDEVLRLVKRVACALESIGVTTGDRVLLSLGRGDNFEFGFWACQLIGATAVPVVSIESGSRRLAMVQHVVSIQRSALATAFLYDGHVGASDLTEIAAAGAKTLCVDECVARSDFDGDPTPGRSRYALLQYTSGTTSAPKGCALTHEAVLTNTACAIEQFAPRPGGTHVHWIPLHHDMGLMGAVLSPILAHLTSVIISPRRFMMRPLCWLNAVADCGRVTTSVPNFALAMVMKRRNRIHLKPESLSEVESIVCGAEPIDVDLVDDFLSTLAPFGLRPESFRPSYGMAETVVLASSRRGAVIAQHCNRRYASVGVPVRGTRFRIVDASGRDVEAGQTGEVLLCSTSLMEGYFNNPTATELKICDGWMHTGDEGFIQRGELFVTGRISDVIIVAGQNIFPLDIEAAVSRASGIDARRIAAFGVRDDLSTDAIVVVVEARQSDSNGETAKVIAAACFSACGVAPRTVITCRIGTLPRTTSGKLRRASLRDRYLSGNLAEHAEAGKV